MNKKYFIVLFFAFFTFCVVHTSKAQFTNSVYSMYGIGQIIDNGFGVNKSLGGTGIAFQTGRTFNYLNPASYLGIPTGSYNMEIGVVGILNRSKNTKTFQTVSNINFSHCSVGLCFTDKWALTLGILPYSMVDYEIYSSDQIEGEPVSFEKKYTGSGGLSKFFMGNSFKLFKGLAVGFNTSFINGPISHSEIALSSGGFSGYELVNDYTANAFYLDYGVQYSVDKDDWQYTIGMVYGPGKKLNTINNLEFTYNDETTYLREDSSIYAISIPESFGIGLAVKYSYHFRAGIDYKWNRWSDINFSNPNFDTKNSNRFSFGMEYVPGDYSVWYKRFFYRFGAFYKNSYLELDNNQINSYGLSFGLGLPNRILSDLNMSLEYGQEGTTDNNLIKNHYWMLDVSFSVSEFFVKRKRK